jgi:gas vesicle protein
MKVLGGFMRIGKYESSDGAAGTAIAFLLIGLGIGAAVGLLLAPKTGRQLRKDLRRSYDDALETVSDWTDEARGHIKDAVEKGADIADDLSSKAEPLKSFIRRS